MFLGVAGASEPVLGSGALQHQHRLDVVGVGEEVEAAHGFEPVARKLLEVPGRGRCMARDVDDRSGAISRKLFQDTLGAGTWRIEDDAIKGNAGWVEALDALGDCGDRKVASGATKVTDGLSDLSLIHI